MKTTRAGYIFNRRILVVEDQADIVQAYLDILVPKPVAAKLKSSRSQNIEKNPENENLDHFEVVTVRSGEAALLEVKKAIADKKPFAMGFFDVLLGPGLDGIDTVKGVHEIDSEMYAILVTAYQDRHVNSIQKVFGKDFQDRWDYLNKPFSEGEILQKARNMTSMWNIRRLEEIQRTEIDEMNRKLGENEKLLTLAAVARSVGHEFGNILLQIMGRADLSRDGNQAEMKSALDTILKATEHASQVLDRFKNLGRSPDHNKLEKASVIEPIKDTILLMEHELKRKQIKVYVDAPQLPVIPLYKTELVQVFMNLVINAIHAMGEKGKIEIHGRVVDEMIEIKVRDTGPGIKPANLKTIFEPFFTTKGEKGTGLGLSICKEVVEINHGGKLTVSNHPDGGAEFCVLIPMSHQMAKEGEAA